MASSLIYLIYPLNMVCSIAILVYQSVKKKTTKCEEQAATTNNYINNKHQTAPDGAMLI
jgi:hypothetical protein